VVLETAGLNDNELGATLSAAVREISISLRTLKRSRRAFLGDGDGEDHRKGGPRHVMHRLSEEERRQILLTCNQPEHASLPPGQVVSALADQDLFTSDLVSRAYVRERISKGRLQPQFQQPPRPCLARLGT
jgi:hypothetical protein